MDIKIKVNNEEVNGMFTVVDNSNSITCELLTHKFINNIKVIENDRFKVYIKQRVAFEISSLELMVKQVFEVKSIDCKDINIYSKEELELLEKEYFKEELNNIESILGRSELEWNKMN